MTKPDDIQERMDEQVDDAWRVLLSNAGGRAVIWSILERCGLFQSTYTGNAQGTYLEGRRAVALQILDERVMPAGPDIFPMMMTEANRRARDIEEAIKREQQENKL